MIQLRLWTAIVIAGWLWAAATAPAQDNSGGAASGGTAQGGSSSGGSSSGDNSNPAGGGDQSGGNGASSSFGTGNSNGSQPSTPLWPPLPSTPGADSQGPSTPGSPNNQGGNGAGNGTGNGNTAGNGTANGTGNGTTPPFPTQTSGAASSFGYTGVKPPAAAIPSTLPTAYGATPQIFSAPGISRPRYHYSISIQAGGDDNVLATPTNSPGQREVIEKVEISPAVAPFTILLPLPAPFKHRIVGKPRLPTQFRAVTFPGTRAHVVDVVVSPAVPAQSRIASPVMQVHGSFDVSFATHRTEFSMHVDLGEYIYANRPGGKTDPSDSFNLAYAHKITPRLVFRANVGAQYINQPDVQSANTPSTNVGSYLVESSSFALDYKWTKRFSTVGSFGLNGNYYRETAQQTANEIDSTFDLQNRYLWSPRLTVLVEGTYARRDFPNNVLRNSTEYGLLLGADLTLSNKFSDSLRVGESLDQFNGGQSASLPSFDNTLSWRFNRAGFLNWSARYGFEDPPDANTTVKTLRTGLTVIQAFGPRWKASAGITYENRASVSAITQAQTGVAAASSTQETILLTLGFEYALTRRTSLTGSYTYTDILNTGGIGDYYRNQLFFGVTYSF